MRAFNARDGNMLERLLTEDYLLTNPEGRTLGRTEFIDEILNRPPDTIAATTVYEVRTYGDSAVVVANFRVTEGGRLRPLERFTDSLVRRSGRWYFTATHVSLVEPD